MKVTLIITAVTILLVGMPVFAGAAESSYSFVNNETISTVNWENRNQELNYDKLVHNMKLMGFSGIMTLSGGALLQSVSLILTAVQFSGAIPIDNNYTGATTFSVVNALIGAFAGIGGIVLGTGLIVAIIGYSLVARYMRMKIELTQVAIDYRTGDTTIGMAMKFDLPGGRL